MTNKILEKLKKLLKHERSAREINSLHEAELFAGKIQELLDQYNLSLSDIDIEEQGTDVEREFINKDFKREWKRILINALASVNSCKSIYDYPRMIIVGVKQDREIVYELFSYFSELGEHLATLESRTEKLKNGYTPSKFKGSFMLGYSTTLAYRIKKVHKEALEKVEQTSTALIYIGDKLAKSGEYMEKHIPTKTSRMNMNVGNYDAYQKGVDAGNSVTLSNKVIK